MNLHVGCSGYFYRHWQGPFYPADLPQHRWFAFYAERFDTVEINASFYRFPTESAVRRWIRQAPEGFTYSVKAPRLITHLHKLRHCESEVQRLAQVLAPLEARLAHVLFQMPPSLHFSEETLDLLCTLIPVELRPVIEFRHPGWWREDVIRQLHQAGMIFCSIHAPSLPADLVCSDQGGYLRLHGDPWYRQDYSDTELKDWILRIGDCGCADVWMYFNNDAEGAAPNNARRCKEIFAGIAR